MSYNDKRLKKGKKIITNLNESEYLGNVLNHLEGDPLDKRFNLKKIYSLSNDEYFELLDYEVSLFNSLKGEVFDTSDPKWEGTGQYEFEFEIDSSQVIDTVAPKSEIVLFTQKNITVNVDVDVTGTVFLGSTMINNPGRDWELREAIQNRSMGHIIVSEIRDIIYDLLEQRLPLLLNLETLDVCDIRIEWVTKLSNVDKNINEGVLESKEDVDKDFLDKVVNNLISETKPTSEKHVSVITPFFVSGAEKYWILTAHRCREIGIVHPENYMVPSIISNHLKDVYSLRTIKEMEYVMDKYYFNIYNKYFRKFFDNTMNESSATFGGNENFLNKMVDFMVDDTELVELEEQPYIRIKFPFIKYSSRRLPHKWYEAVPRFPFIEGMVDNYGLTDDEAEYVLEKYSDKLRSKVFSIRKGISDRVNK
jgi:hypothetical protein